MEKPTLRLTGTDGNVFAIIGACVEAARKAKLPCAKTFANEAMACDNYDAVLRLAMQHFNIE